MDEEGGPAQHIGDVTISHRFCGPPNSANGGYTCGQVAQYLERHLPGPATVRLMKPPPLDAPMGVYRRGGEIELRLGDDIIARAWPEAPDVEVPQAPTLESARARRAHYAGIDEAAFPTCFVCGIARKEGDGLRIHAGPDPDANPARRHVACTWTPHSSLCGDDGTVPAHFIWAALDCPGGWAFLSSGDEVALLGEFSAEIHAPLRCSREYIVAGWEISRDGRKRRTGSAIYAEDGRPLARALATWITVSQ